MLRRTCAGLPVAPQQAGADAVTDRPQQGHGRIPTM
jgi:hypothetical protein